ncbi:MAG: DNA repair protein RecO [Fusobacteriaceae bacterium]|jgi:DNA repair protein RecO|nr:DNA repair protein RecO [Fusobacteriaceae bacterium]
MISISGEGIVINKWDYGEADRAVDVFMRDYGKITLGVRGVLKSRKRETAAVDVMTRSEFTLYSKNEKWILSDFTLIDSHREIRENPANLEIGLCVLGILNKILPAKEKKERLYDLSEKTLGALKKTGTPRRNYLLLTYYLHSLIRTEGLQYGTSGQGLYFSPDGAGFTKRKTGTGSAPVSEKTRMILEKLHDNKVGELLDEEGPETEHILAALALLEKYINYHFEIHLMLKNYLIGGYND